MNCSECQKNFSLYRDQILNPPTASQVQEHLEQCPECQKQWLKWQKSLNLLQGLPCLQVPADLNQLIQQKIHRQVADYQKISWLSRIWTPKIWIAAVGLAAVLLLSVYNYEEIKPIKPIIHVATAYSPAAEPRTLEISSNDSLTEWTASSTSSLGQFTPEQLEKVQIPHITLDAKDSEEIVSKIEAWISTHGGEYQESLSSYPESIWVNLTPESWKSFIEQLDSLSPGEKEQLLMATNLNQTGIILELESN